MAIKIEGGSSTNKLTDQHGNVLAEWDATTGELVAGNFFGVGVSWQEAELTDTGATFDDGTPSYRAPGVTYTNDKPYPIEVSLSKTDTTLRNFYVNGELVAKPYDAAASYASISITIPSGHTYLLDGGEVSVWSELR